MKPRSLALAVLALLLAACNYPGSAPASATPDLVATAVAGTMAAGPLAAPSVTSEPGLLPHALLYLSDRSGSPQVWRLETDGVTQTQLTDVDGGVQSFDVSPADGRVVYVADNQLYMLEDGGSPVLMVDNASADPNAEDYFTTQHIDAPHFSPDGRYLAYSLDGLWILDLSTNEAVHLLRNQLDPEHSDPAIVQPLAWAPNSLQLLLMYGDPVEGSSLAFVNPGQERLVTPIDSDGFACCHTAWAPDSNSLLLASPYDGLVEAGLWRYDAFSGEAQRLIPEELDGLFQFAAWPLELPNGDLQYFYASSADQPAADHALFMVRSAPDGVTGRAQLRPDAFGSLGEALWAPDGSLALVVQLRAGGGPGGAVLLSPAGEQQLQLLLDDGYMLRWGE